MRRGAKLKRSVRCALAAAAATFVAAFSIPVDAQVRLVNEAGGNYEVYVMSWWEIPFRSVVRQQYDFSCGSAAISTLLTHHFDRPTTERESFAAMWKQGDQKTIRKVGFSMFEMKTFAESIGYRAEGYRLTPARLAKLPRPSIVLVDLKGFKHFVVVKGVRGDRILVGDPMLGLSEYSLADFSKIWNGIALVIVDAPGDRKPKFNLAGDWGPWSKAPLEGGAIRVLADDLTTYLPPTYQLTPQILLDVRVGTVR